MMDEKEQKLQDKLALDNEFSLSEDLVLLNNSSPASETGSLTKKKKKFKPTKFISKHLKIKQEGKRDDESNDGQFKRTLSTSSKEVNESYSPKFENIKKTFVKSFSRKKKYKVGPMESGEKENDATLSYTQSEASISSSRETIEQDDLNENVIEKSFYTGDDSIITKTATEITESMSEATKEANSLGESKKVQLKITILGKVNTTSSSETTTTIVSENEIDKASSPIQGSSTDIMLPSTSTARLSAMRNDFFNVTVPRSNANINVEQQIVKSISDNTLLPSVVFTSSTQEGYTRVESVTEIEKYSVLTSNLNSIITATEDLDKLNIVSEDNLTELRIYEQEDVHLTLQSADNDKQYSDNEDNMKKSKIPRRLSEAANDKEHGGHTVHTQEAHKPYHLSFSSSTDDTKITPVMKSNEDYSSSTNVEKSENIPPNELNVEVIKFEVGTPVRPQKILSTSSNITPLIITETESSIIDSPTIVDSMDDVFHSPINESSLTVSRRKSSTRRKIAYIPQLTIYTPEEQELLKSNILANSDSFDSSSSPLDSSIFPTFDDISLASNMTYAPEKREHLYKILVIGELGTGKTSFIKRYVHQFFSQNYRATIGVDFALKVINWDQSTIIRLQLWDIAGQERFGNMTRVYYKEAVGAFIVFDCTRIATFDAVSKWKQDLDAKVQLPDGNPIPCILLANKCDQQKQGLVTMPAKMDEYCQKNGFAGWFETSAKENTNVDESAKALVSKILLNDKHIHNDIADADRLILDSEDGIQKPKKFCSC